MKLKMSCLMISVLVFTCIVSGAEEKDNEFERQWGNDIRNFEQLDAKNSFVSDAVLFVGSSSIRMWETARHFPEQKVINRGFGGSRIRDVNYFFDRIVTRYQPRTIALYAGDNDIAGGLSPETVLDDFKTFADLCGDRLPDARVIYISIKPSKARLNLWPEMREANRLIEEFCETRPNLSYMDLASCFLDSEDTPIDKYYLADKLHLSETGYQVWSRKLQKSGLMPGITE